jgi:2-C-methyl-D-erythritol 4-phosphate cytidylyltransferase/2-C-methyl-D-erythritol 2,4-cyclodiphosphate synthase
MNPSQVAAIIPAAGSGSRMGLAVPKQFFALQGIPILIHTLRVFQQAESVGLIVVVVPPESCAWAEDLVHQYRLAKILRVLPGGRFRQDSVLAGLEALPPEVDIVVVHDGVRPFVTVSLIENCLQEAAKSGAAMAAVPAKDTLKFVSSEKVIEHTINRDGVWQAQTPQVFKKSLLVAAYARAAGNKDFMATDEAGLLELLGHPVKVVEGSETNIKITRQEDLLLAKAILMESEADRKTLEGNGHYCSGYGYDAHRLVEGRPLVLGGERISHNKGLQGHSDADVLTHAFCDALLGAAGAGDIGVHFPDTDEKFKDMSSLKILADVVELVAGRGYVLQNADITVVAQKPKLAPHFAAMKENLAAASKVDPERINLKATTTETMGFEGREEGMSAHAVVMLKKQ